MDVDELSVLTYLRSKAAWNDAVSNDKTGLLTRVLVDVLTRLAEKPVTDSAVASVLFADRDAATVRGEIQQKIGSLVASEVDWAKYDESQVKPSEENKKLQEELQRSNATLRQLQARQKEFERQESKKAETDKAVNALLKYARDIAAQTQQTKGQQKQIDKMETEIKNSLKSERRP